MKRTFLFMATVAMAMVMTSCGQKADNKKCEKAAADTTACCEKAQVCDSAAVVADSTAAVADSVAAVADSVAAE